MNPENQENKINELTAIIDRLSSRIETLEEMNIDSYLSTISYLEDKINIMEKDKIKGIENTISQLSVTVSRNKTNISEMDEALTLVEKINKRLDYRMDLIMSFPLFKFFVNYVRGRA